jgi:dihydrofolate reductase
MNGAFAILATDRAGGIGKNGELPWPKIPGELAWFRKMTMGKTVLVGRKTFEKLPALKGRRVVVLTRQAMTGHETTNDLNVFLANNRDVAIIGGAEVYKQVFPMVDTWYITTIDAEYDCDTSFPIDWFDGGINSGNQLFERSLIHEELGTPKWSVMKWERKRHEQEMS